MMYFMCPMFSTLSLSSSYVRTWFYCYSYWQQINLFTFWCQGHGYLGFMKFDLDYAVSSFSYVVVDENVAYAKWHNKLAI